MTGLETELKPLEAAARSARRPTLQREAVPNDLMSTSATSSSCS
jgi:hypothetical protein